jgi:hypothetical protein
MHSWIRKIAPSAVLILLSCGNYSTEDLAFFEALPTSELLRVSVPLQASEPICGALGQSQVWGWAKPAGDNINSGVDWILAIVDLVRQVSPTTRSKDQRTWGPFDDLRHPGREVQIRIDRSVQGDTVRFDYIFEARVKGLGTFLPVITGSFNGPSARRGTGDFTVHFAAIWLLNMNDERSPRGQVVVHYDRTGDPRTTELALQQSAGFGLVQFNYSWQGYEDESGVFAYAFQNAQGDLLTVTAYYDGQGQGRADTAVVASGGAWTGDFSECWDADACLIWVSDPGNYKGLCADAPCVLGNPLDCPVQ